MKLSQKTRRIYRVILIGLTAVVLAGGLLYGLARRNAGIPEPSGTGTVATSSGLTDKQLMQQLVSMILEPDRFEELADGIPAAQRIGVSDDNLFRYVALLRSGIRGRITAFESMPEEEMDVVRDEIGTQAPAYADRVDGLDGFWIFYTTTTGQEEQFSVYLHLGDAGQALLSPEWIGDMLAIQDDAALYFNAIETANEQALALLVHSSVDDPDILLSKAESLIRFYGECVPGNSGSYRLIHARADSFAYEQRGIDLSRYYRYQPVMEDVLADQADDTPTATPTPLPVPQAQTTRMVQILQPVQGRMQVIDPVPYDVSATDLSVYSDERPLLGLGEYVYSFELNARLGERLTFFYMPASAPFDPDLQIIQALHEGITVTLIGTVNETALSFSGNVFAIEFLSDVYETGAGLGIGASRSDVLRLYPFSDLTDWNICTIGAYDCITCTLRDSQVQKVRISRLGEELDERIRTTPGIYPELS